jgi:hypothetical protein
MELTLAGETDEWDDDTNIYEKGKSKAFQLQAYGT